MRQQTPWIETPPIIAVLVIENLEDAVPLAQTLVKGGVTAIELTLRTNVAFDALKEIVKEVPQLTVGVGTILTVEQVNEAFQSGASFGVSPGVNKEVISEANRLQFPFAPGIVTPTDIETALQCGNRTLKFFPAELSGGLPYLKSISAPYAHLGLKFIPLGGVNENNLETWLSEPSIAAVGGSWIAPQSLINEKNWEEIFNRAKKANEIAHQVRSC